MSGAKFWVHVWYKSSQARQLYLWEDHDLQRVAHLCKIRKVMTQA